MMSYIWIVEPIFFVLLIILALDRHFTRRFNHWKRKGVPYLKPMRYFGSMYDVFTFKYSIGEAFQKVYLKYKNPFVGMYMFNEPILLIRDPELIKSVLVKDFNYFIDRTVTDNEEDDPMGTHILFVLKNPDWKEIRRKITPVFTSGKMKLMYKLILESGEDLVKYLNKTIEQNDIIETREICAKYTTETITSTSFGIKANCFNNEQAQFRMVSRRIFNWNILSRGIATTCYFMAPTLVKLFHMKFIDEQSADFLRKAFWTTMEEREKNKIQRDDLLDILIQMRKEEKFEDPYKLDGDKLVAQATQFFIAGYETTSSTISFALYELAKNLEIQNTLRDEIKNTLKKHGTMSYDALKDMTYLEMCVQETLRKYPVLPFLDRRCNQPYQIPGTDIVVEKGTGVYISNIGLHYDPEYYPNPEKFDPLRFTEEKKNSRPAFTYLPFGEGPRNCIGARFGQISSKSGLAHIIQKFKVDICEETQKEMKFHPRGFLLAPENGIKLKFTKL